MSSGADRQLALPAAAVVSVALHLAIGAAVVGVGALRAHGTGEAALTGDTFELPRPETVGVTIDDEGDDRRAEAAEDPSEHEQPSPEPPSAIDDGAEKKPTPRPSHPSRPSRHTPSTAASRDASASSEGASASADLYGAVGERSAVDLMTSFIHSFPQAASGDPIWLNVPFGKAGEGDVELSIDASGSFASAHLSGFGGNAALTRGVERTVALIRGRTFTSPSLTLRMHLAATVSPDQAHDGAEGSVFAIGRTFAPRGGTAFFALAVGRRVDLVVTVR
jgi:hypothetical protein